MKNFKTIKVKYIDSVEKVGEEYIPRYKYKEVSGEFIRVFMDESVNMYGLSACARDVITFLSILMDDDNICDSSLRTIKKFNDFLLEASNLYGKRIHYAESSIRKAFSELERRKCLIKLTRGIYQVNPRLMFKGSDAKRKKAIKQSDEYLQGFRDNLMQLKYVLKEDLIDEENVYGNGIEPCVID